VIDLDELTAGQALPPLQLPPISRTTLALFAGASGDHNPIHIDIDAARAAGEPDVFAHGMLSMAYLGMLLTEHLPQSALRAWSVRFSARTPVHAQVTCRAVVQDVSGPVGQRRVTLDVRCELADGTVTLQGTAMFSTGFSTDPSVLDATSTGAGP
jgi:acyl dehydratase